MKSPTRSLSKAAFTLVETLIASGIIMIAVGAAASLSLLIVTQDEIAENTLKAANYLHNTAALYQLGLEPDAIEDILPDEPVVENINMIPLALPVSYFSNPLWVMDMEMTYIPTQSTSGFSADSWTGGDSAERRTHTIRVVSIEQNVGGAHRAMR